MQVNMYLVLCKAVCLSRWGKQGRGHCCEQVLLDPGPCCTHALQDSCRATGVNQYQEDWWDHPGQPRKRLKKQRQTDKHRFIQWDGGLHSEIWLKSLLSCHATLEVPDVRALKRAPNAQRYKRFWRITVTLCYESLTLWIKFIFSTDWQWGFKSYHYNTCSMRAHFRGVHVAHVNIWRDKLCPEMQQIIC